MTGLVGARKKMDKTDGGDAQGAHEQIASIDTTNAFGSQIVDDSIADTADLLLSLPGDLGGGGIPNNRLKAAKQKELTASRAL